jgi:ABC-type uncharacterized transport system permease subunit
MTCFAASYGVALTLEITRLFFRSGVRGALMLGFAAAGLVAQTLFLIARGAEGGRTISGWSDWYLLAAWVLAATYLYLTYYHPKNPIGLFVLPLILGLIAVAWIFRDNESFAGGAQVWGRVHGISLLIGTVVVLIGFVAGVMYLIQAYRLKHKLPPPQRFRLPSLEWMQKVNGRSIIVSTILLGVGVLSGLTLNALNHRRDATTAMPWNDPVVWSSALLLIWLIVAAIFNAVYRPARQGRKVAYLTVASMVFLILVLAIVLLGPSQHAQNSAAAQRAGADLVNSDGGAA